MEKDFPVGVVEFAGLQEKMKFGAFGQSRSLVTVFAEIESQILDDAILRVQAQIASTLGSRDGIWRVDYTNQDAGSCAGTAGGFAINSFL